jgi:Tfp pilus assembly protein PilV
MKQPSTLKICRPLKRDASEAGFTVIETLVAGLVIAAVMTAVGRLSVAGMAASQNQSARNSIEAAINDHIQLLQMQDSYLTQEAITSTAGLNSSMESACASPSTFLKDHLQKPEVAGVVEHPAVELEWNVDNPYLLVVTHSFEAPETSIGLEKRITELNPNFSSQCYDLQ